MVGPPVPSGSISVAWVVCQAGPVTSPVAASLQQLARIPSVAESIDAARQACTQLRWHEGLRRRTTEAAAESRVRGAVSSAYLDGAELAGSSGTVPLVRDLMRGAVPWPDRVGPVERVTRAAVRATAATEEMTTAAMTAPLQALARLHLAAAGDLVPAAAVGRPRTAIEDCTELTELGPAVTAAEIPARLHAVAELLGSIRAGAPVALVAAVVHAEILAIRPFVAGNGIVARAMERVILRVGGIDPTGVAVPEAGHVGGPGTNYIGALTGYTSAGRDGVLLWLDHWGQAMVRGAAHGGRVADAVRLGRSDGAEVTPGRASSVGSGVPKTLRQE